MTTTLPVLTFHALDARASVISYAPQVFRDSIAMLHAAGYRTIPLLEAVDHLRQGQAFPEQTFVLTFDDGYQSVYTAAFPVLQQYGMTATVFLTVGRAGTPHATARLPMFEGRAMLSWLEIREMQRAGIDFGAHTLTHPDLTTLPAARVVTEMAASKACIEDALGTAVRSFAYPFGRYDAQSRALAQQHFTCACADTLGLLSRRSDPYAMERVDAYYLRTHRLAAVMRTRVFPWYVLARNVPRQLRRALTRRIRL
jgi:peptidoglycan/xylan/chitin deacetylase (PgdA/CDA1 family)